MVCYLLFLSLKYSNQSQLGDGWNCSPGIISLCRLCFIQVVGWKRNRAFGKDPGIAELSSGWRTNQRARASLLPQKSQRQERGSEETSRRAWTQREGKPPRLGWALGRRHRPDSVCKLLEFIFLLKAANHVLFPRCSQHHLHSRQLTWRIYYYIDHSGREHCTWKALVLSPRTNKYAYKKRPVTGYQRQRGTKSPGVRASRSQEMFALSPHSSSQAHISEVRREPSEMGYMSLSPCTAPLWAGRGEKALEREGKGSVWM